jgi:hypothetical protein
MLIVTLRSLMGKLVTVRPYFERTGCLLIVSAEEQVRYRMNSLRSSSLRLCDAVHILPIQIERKRVDEAVQAVTGRPALESDVAL